LDARHYVTNASAPSIGILDLAESFQIESGFPAQQATGKTVNGLKVRAHHEIRYIIMLTSTGVQSDDLGIRDVEPLAVEVNIRKFQMTNVA